MEIVVGTYDEVLIGFRAIRIGKVLQLETNFTDNSHAGCIKCITISPKGILASGSTDETIRLLNIRKKKEIGSLVHHSGTVTSLEFQKNFLFSTSEDKTLCLWKSANWECLKTFRGHKYGVNCVSVHPSGKLALTVGNDRKLMTWNLITGRSAYITNIKEVAEIVKWSPDGELYLNVSNNKIDVYCVQTAAVKSTIKSEFRVSQLQFYSNDICVYAGEGGDVIFYDIAADKVVHTCHTGTNRIKGLCITKSPLEETGQVLCVGSSDGRVLIYDITYNDSTLSTSLLVDHNASFRITCMAVYNSTESKHSEIGETSLETEEVDNENYESKTKDTEAQTDKSYKSDGKGVDIDENDLDMVVKRLYDDECRTNNKLEKVNVKKEMKRSSSMDKKKKKSISFSDKVSIKREREIDEEDMSDKKTERKKKAKKDSIDYKNVSNNTTERESEMPLKLRDTVTVVQENDRKEKKRQKRIEKLKLNKKMKKREEKRSKMKSTEGEDKFHMKRKINYKAKGNKEKR